MGVCMLSMTWAMLMMLWVVVVFVISMVVLTIEVKRSGSAQIVSKWMTKVMITGVLLVFFSPVVYRYPPGQWDTPESVPRVVTFEGDRMVYKQWGMWKWPWGDKRGIHVNHCKPVGSSLRFGLVAEETRVVLSENGTLSMDRFHPELCLDNPEVFFSDRIRRSQNGFKFGWMKADSLALQAFFSSEMSAWRHSGYKDDGVGVRHRALLAELFNSGFVVHEKHHTY